VTRKPLHFIDCIAAALPPNRRHHEVDAVAPVVVGLRRPFRIARISDPFASGLDAPRLDVREWAICQLRRLLGDAPNDTLGARLAGAPCADERLGLVLVRSSGASNGR
jgi:hypothetical protein